MQYEREVRWADEESASPAPASRQGQSSYRGGTKSPFHSFRIAREKAHASKANSFTWEGKTYVKGKLSNGLPMYRRRSKRASGGKKKSKKNSR